MNSYYSNNSIKLYHGDCLQILPILDIKFDCCITDLPYQITKNSWDIIIPFDLMWKNLDIIMKQNSAILLFGSQPFSSLLTCSNLKMFKHEWIWQKNRGSNFANTVRQPFKEHEHILCFSKGKWTYNKQMQQRAESGKSRANYKIDYITSSDNYRKFQNRYNNQLSNLRVPSSIQKFNTQVGLHPTQKPVKLIEYLIKTYSNPNDTILDFCAGSGTTGLACMNTNRKCILIQKEEKYCEVIAKRLEDKQIELSEQLF